jgi:L-alanine-DL-glutamate epimerase-like enolase superfamily enzyme
VSDVVKVAQALEPFRLLWLEDPVPPDSIEALRAGSARVKIPIATGENLYLFEGFREILQTHAVGIATPDLQKVGGLAVAAQIAQFADAQTIPVAPHNISSPVGTLASAHFCAAIPNFLVLEFHASDVPFWNDLVDGTRNRLFRTARFNCPTSPASGSN